MGCYRNTENKLKLKQAIQSLGETESIGIAKQIAISEGVDWADGACFVFSVIVNDLDRVPGNIGAKADNEQDVIRKWLLKYKGGYEGRASQRISKPLGTVADPIISDIIGARLPGLKNSNLADIAYAHRLGMSAENILGLVLEEYLNEGLKDNAWHCAWGETVKSVDFVSEYGGLLQIKNRSNSENSSSSSVREGTIIQKWYRIEADRIEYRWDELNEICNTDYFSEESFVTFAQKTLESNPGCLAIEETNPWKKRNVYIIEMLQAVREAFRTR